MQESGVSADAEPEEALGRRTNATLTEAIAPTEQYNDNPYAQRWFARELNARPTS